MDIRVALATEHSRRNAERVAAFAGSDPAHFRVLMACVLENAPIIAQRASYSMSIAVEADPPLITPYLKELVTALDRPSHEAVKRNTIRILQFCELPVPLRGRILNAVLSRIHDAQCSIAQRAFAITVALRLARLYPELANELRPLLEGVLLQRPSPGIRSRAKKALAVLHRTHS